MTWWILLVISANTQVNLKPLKSLAFRHYFGSKYERYVRLWKFCYKRYPEFSDWLLKLRVEKELAVQNFDSTTHYLERLVTFGYSNREMADLFGQYFSSFSEGSDYSELLNVLEMVKDVWRRFRPDGYLFYYAKVLSRQLPDSAAKLKKRLILEYPDSPYAFLLIPDVEGLDSVSVGLVYYYAGRYKDALRLLPARKYPKEHLLSLYYLREWRKFLDSFRELATLLSSSERHSLKFKRAIVFEKLGKYEEAIGELVNLAKGSPQWLERAVSELSNLAIEKGWIYKILKVLKSLPQKESPVYSRLGLLYFTIADTSRAMYWFKKNLNSEDNFYRPQAYYFIYRLTRNQTYLDSLLSNYPLSYYLWLTGLPPKNFYQINTGVDTVKVSNRFKLFSYLQDNEWAKNELSSDKFDLSYAFYSRTMGNAYLSAYIAGRIFLRTGSVDSTLLSMLFPYPKKWQPVEGLGLSIPLVLALIREESTFRYNAISPAGAIGFMQLIPKTYLHITDSEDYTEVFRPIENLKTGAKYLEQLLNDLGDTVLAIAAYNAGPTRVKKWWNNWKKRAVIQDPVLFVEFIPYRETRNYTRRVLRSMRVYQWLYRFEYDTEK